MYHIHFGSMGGMLTFIYQLQLPNNCYLCKIFQGSKEFGDAGYRSPCLSHAKRALYHLSYTPCRRNDFMNYIYLFAQLSYRTNRYGVSRQMDVKRILCLCIDLRPASAFKGRKSTEMFFFADLKITSVTFFYYLRKSSFFL